MSNKKKKKSKGETLSKFEKSRITESCEGLEKSIVTVSFKLCNYIDAITIDTLDRFDKLFMDFLSKYDNEYYEIINKDTTKEVISNISKYLEFENILRGFEIFGDIFVNQSLDHYLKDIEDGIKHDAEEIKNHTRLITEFNVDIKHKEEVISKINAKTDTLMNRELKNKKDILKSQLEDVATSIKSYIAEEVSSRLNNINTVNEFIETFENGELFEFVLYESNKPIHLNIADIPFESNRNVRISAQQGIKYDKTIASLTDITDTFITKELQKQSNLSSNGGMIRFDDGRRVIIDKNNEIKIDSTTITDKSYSHKELNKLANELGYKEDRYNGDHLILTNEKGKNIVIPQRAIGRGLQLKILKDLDVI